MFQVIVSLNSTTHHVRFATTIRELGKCLVKSIVNINGESWHGFSFAACLLQCYCVRGGYASIRSAVGEDGFASAGGEGVDGGVGGQVDGAGGGVIGEEEDAVGAGPEVVEVGVGGEDLRGVGP
jgi:hypothetical protein